MEEKNYPLPQICIAGGFATEDHLFKGLSLGAPYINMIGIGRGAMTAAMVGKRVGELLKEEIVPKELQRFGSSKEEIFEEIRELKTIYGDKLDVISTGAIGVYSYLSRLSTGLRQFMALNRKFTLKHIDRDDIVPLTELAREVTGLKTHKEHLEDQLDRI